MENHVGKCSCRIRTLASSQFLLVPFATQGSKWVLTNFRGDRDEIPEGELGEGVKLWWSTISFCKEAICFVAWKPGKAPAAVRIKVHMETFPFFLLSLIFINFRIKIFLMTISCILLPCLFSFFRVIAAVKCA